jgi:hypothetical protein
MIKAGGKTLQSAIHKLINSILNEAELSLQWKESITVLIYKRVMKKTVVITEGYYCYQLHTKLYTLFLSHC